MENWKFIEGYENKYLISDKGRVKSLIDNKGNKRELIRIPRKAKNGYLYLNLWKGGKSKTKKIHRLVAEHFIDNPDNKLQVNHKDGNKLNNNVSNLEWCTAQENTMHAINMGLMSTEYFFKKGKDNHMFGRHGKDNPCSKPVIQYDSEGNFIKEWENIKIAQKTLNIYHIGDCCLGRRPLAGGYIWKHKLA